MELKHRGWWRKILGLKGDLWYFETRKHQKVADRPHPINITIGLISPALAVTATVISLLSLRTSRESLQIGQRAYLSFQVRNVEVKPLEQYGITGVSFSPTLAIKNLGNTPATILQDYAESQLFTNYTYKHLGGSATGPPLGGGISPKDEVAFDAPDLFLPFDPSTPQNRLVRFLGYVQWSDVFGAKHLDAWCFLFWDQDIKNFADAKQGKSSDKSQSPPRFIACPNGPPPTRSADPKELRVWLRNF